MNRLPMEKRALILTLLVEGLSMRSAARTVGVSINTVTKLLLEAGNVCTDYVSLQMRDLPCTRIEVDELWAFIYAKDKHLDRVKQRQSTQGTVWTWTAICADTRIIPTWFIGDRSAYTARLFLQDLQRRLGTGCSSRPTGTVPT